MNGSDRLNSQDLQRRKGRLVYSIYHIYVYNLFALMMRDLQSDVLSLCLPCTAVCTAAGARIKSWKASQPGTSCEWCTRPCTAILYDAPNPRELEEGWTCIYRRARVRAFDGVTRRYRHPAATPSAYGDRRSLMVWRVYVGWRPTYQTGAVDPISDLRL